MFNLCQILLIFSSKIFIKQLPAFHLFFCHPGPALTCTLSPGRRSGLRKLAECLCSTFFRSPSSLRDLPKWQSLARLPLVKYSPVTPHHQQDTFCSFSGLTNAPLGEPCLGGQPPRTPPTTVILCETAHSCMHHAVSLPTEITFLSFLLASSNIPLHILMIFWCILTRLWTTKGKSLS